MKEGQMTELCINNVYMTKLEAETRSTRVGAVTANKIRAMRNEKAKAKPLHILILNQLNDTISAISALISLKSLTGNSKMCEHYGHVIDNKNWKGHLPRCADCHAIIDDPKSLRKATCDGKSLDFN